MATGTAPLSPAARDYHTAQTHFVSKSVAFNTVVSGSSVVVGTIPANSIILRAIAVITTPFNADSTNTISVGTLASSVALISSANATTAGVVTTTLISTAASAVIFPTTELIITARFGQTGAVASAGAAQIVVEYARLLG